MDSGNNDQEEKSKRLFHETVLLETINKLHETLLKIDNFSKEYIP